MRNIKIDQRVRRFGTPRIKLQLGQDEMTLIVKVEDNIEVEHWMLELVDVTFNTKNKAT